MLMYICVNFIIVEIKMFLHFISLARHKMRKVLVCRRSSFALQLNVRSVNASNTCRHGDIYVFCML